MPPEETPAPTPDVKDPAATGVSGTITDAKAAEAAKAEPAPVVDMLAADLGDKYPELKAMEEAAAKGLKFPVDQKWVDENMKDSRFRAYVHGLRGMASKGREATVSEQKAVQAEREALAQDRAAVQQDRAQIAKEIADFKAIVEAIPKAPEEPAGGAPNPKSPDPKVQEFYAQKYVAKMFDPVRAKLGELDKVQADLEAKAAVARMTADNDAFIAKTSDYGKYHPEVMNLIATGEATTPEAAYHVVKARALRDAPPPTAAAVAASKGPDLSKMTSTEVTLYALEHPGWKPPADALKQMGLAAK